MIKGIYILLIFVPKNLEIKVGKLGNITFSIGFYAYIGSAQNNLEKRIERHIKKKKKIFWHIDYLLSNKFVKINEIYYKKSKKDEECNIANKLNPIANPIIGFGCSDCNCKSHLFKIEDYELFSNLMKKLRMKSYLLKKSQ